MKLFTDKREAQYIANCLGTFTTRFRVEDRDGSYAIASVHGYATEAETWKLADEWRKKFDIEIKARRTIKSRVGPGKRKYEQV